MASNHSLENKKVLITCGPTWIPIDSVRVLSNISSGEMGQLFAQSLDALKADVTVLQGQVLKTCESKFIKVLEFKYFNELENLLKTQLKKRFDVIIHAAAVSDFEIQKTFKTKIDSKKSLTLKLKPTKKLIKLIRRLQPDSILIGFKLENQINASKSKQLAAKLFKDSDCDLVVVNSVDQGKYQAFVVNQNLEIITEEKSKQSLVKTVTQLLKANYEVCSCCS